MNTFLFMFGVLAISFAVTSAAPVDQIADGAIFQTLENKQVIDVPPNCPPNEAADDNGRCRQIYQQESGQQATLDYIACLIRRRANPALAACVKESKSFIKPLNVIEVPPTCPPGQLLDHSGRCRPIYRTIQLQNVIPVVGSPITSVVKPQNVIEVPPTCPPGQLLDHNGRCRPIHKTLLKPQNVIEVPPTCPAGQLLDQTGRCRPIARNQIPVVDI